MKPVGVKFKTYINFLVEFNMKGMEFKVGDYVQILKCDKISSKGYESIRTEKVLVI